jgi:hypothetical protein
VKTTQEVEFEDVFTVVDACNKHGHTPAFLEVTLSAWRMLVTKMYPPRLEHPLHLLDQECDDEDCQRMRRASRVKPGDEPGTLIGVTVRIVADPPPPIVAVHEPVEMYRDHVA